MSSAPVFRTVIIFGESVIQVFRPHKDTWRVWEEEFSLDSVPSDTLIEAIKGANILAVVSDAFAGHVQLSLPNKKDQLSDQNLAEVLQEQYQIDLSSYEFASQRFAVGRQFVQVSVSGIEKDSFQKVLEWTRQLFPKKLWVMPFGWFVSTLKAVEPALIAVVEDSKRVHVSHHYLGVDDARQITLDQLVAYGESRKEERKETHLLYVQADKKLFEKVESMVGESLAVHPLISDAEGEVMEAVVNAVMDKGQETLKELLHFEPDLEEVASAEVPLSAPEQAAILEEGLENTPPPQAEELPKPTLPKPSVASATLVAPELPPYPYSEGEVLDSGEIVGEVKEEEEVLPSPQPVTIEEVVEEVETATPVVTAKEIPEVVAQEPEKEDIFLSQLQQSKVGAGESKESRYVEVASKPQWKTAVLVFFIVFGLTAVIGGGIFWSQQSRPQEQALIPTSTPSPSPEVIAEVPSPEPVASLSAEIKKEKKVIVLNATGIAGLAGKVKTKLEKAGWSGVKTGNAAGTSYADAIFVTSEDAELIEVVGTDLGDELTTAPTLKEPAGDGYDVVIVLAKEPSL